jgi:hypothetical protein
MEWIEKWKKQFHHKVNTIDLNAQKLHQGVTVFIPPVTIRSIQNQELLRALDSEHHLMKITEQQST